MRLSTTRVRRGVVPAALGLLLLGAAACQGDASPTAPSLATAAGTCYTATQYMANPIAVGANSTGNMAGWFIKNTGTSTLTLTGGTPVTSGPVTSTYLVNAKATLAPGQRVDVDFTFDVGGPGTGTLAMNVTSSCGTIALPTYTLNVN